MSSPDPSYLDHLSAADIYRDVIFRERIRTTGQEWIVLNDSYAHLNLPQIEIYAQGIRLGGGQGPPAFSWLPPLAGWGLYFKRRVFHYRNGGGPVSGRQTSHRAELMAMHHALLRAPPNHHLVIYTSSYHVWACFEIWFDYWEVYGYTHDGGERVGNRDLIHAIMRERRLRQGKVDIKYVTAPFQDPGILIAEEIASDAARGRY